LRLREHVRRLAQRTGHDLRVHVRVGGVAERADLVEGAVHRRPDEVVEAGVDQDVVDRAAALGGAHLGQQQAALRHEVAPGLDLERQVAAELARQRGARLAPGLREPSDVDARLARAVGDRQPAAGREALEAGPKARARPASAWHTRERFSRSDPSRCARADRAAELERARAAQRGLELGVPDPVLRVLAARAHLAVVPVAEARVDAQTSRARAAARPRAGRASRASRR
jgi:hypothetical protein